MPAPHHLLIPRRRPRLLSVVVPVYNEQEVLPAFRRRLTACVDALSCPAEVVLVNDGSADGSVRLLADWADADSRVRVLCLARNFGHQAALTAGLDAAIGEAVVLMDADLQDPPELIADLLTEYGRGYDVVLAVRRSRGGEGLAKRLTAWAFYRAMRRFVHPDLPPDAGDFRLVSRPCLDALGRMRETHRFLRGMVAWVGFPQTAVPFDRPARAAGQTKYPPLKMLKFAWTAAVSFSPAPLRISLVAGAGLALFGLIDGAYAVGRSALGYYNVPGWTSVMAALCLIGGGILLSLGILGEYVGRIFEQGQGRPLYVISARLGGNCGTGVPPASSTTNGHAEPVLREVKGKRGRDARATAEVE